MKVIFTSGLPGSGKSTWAKEYCIKNKDWVRVNRDDLRNMRGQYWLPKDEGLINSWERSFVKIAIGRNKNVIVDATNFNKKYKATMKHEIIEYCKDIGVQEPEFETKFFDVSIEECIKRDMKRPNSVGEKVIRDMYNRYLKKNIKIQQDKTLPRAIICDLDGTLCLHNGRSPFEYDKCDTDLVNKPVRDILLGLLSTRHFIFMSGREDSCKKKSIEWIKDNLLIESFEVYMRKTGDYRKDSIVKKELFDNHIKDKYYVEFVLDDRNQVVEMWRDLGLTCLQVAEGDF